MISVAFQRAFVEQYLQDYYFVHDEKPFSLQDVAMFCEEEFSVRTYLKSLLRIQRHDINMIIVTSYITSLPDELQKFLSYKVRDRMPMVKISIHMSASEPMLFSWYNDIIDNLCDLLFFNLNNSMIFNQQLLLSLVEALDKQINFIEQNYKYVEEFLCQDWYYLIYMYRDRFGLILHCLLQCINADCDKDEYSRIIRYKSQHLNENVSEISGRFNKPQSRISRYFKRFRDEIQKKLEKDFYNNPRPVRIIPDVSKKQDLGQDSHEMDFVPFFMLGGSYRALSSNY